MPALLAPTIYLQSMTKEQKHKSVASIQRIQRYRQAKCMPQSPTSPLPRLPLHLYSFSDNKTKQPKKIHTIGRSSQEACAQKVSTKTVLVIVAMGRGVFGTALALSVLEA